MTDVVSIDPRTAEVAEVVATEHSTADVARACERAAAAARPLDESAALAAPRCCAPWRGSSTRTAPTSSPRRPRDRPRRRPSRGREWAASFQFRLFAEALRDGGYLEATIDHAGADAAGRRPRHPPHARAHRTGRGVRIEQLPVRVLGRRRRHGVGARRRQQRRAQGALVAPRDVSAILRGDRPLPRPSTARPTASSASSTAPRPAGCSSRIRSCAPSASPGRSAAGRRCSTSSTRVPSRSRSTGSCRASTR